MSHSNIPQPGSRATDGATSSFSVHRVLEAVRCWWKIVTPIALLLAAGAGAGVYFSHKPTYSAQAWLLIKEKPDVIVRSLDIDSKRFIENQMEVLRSPKLLGPLAQKPEIIAVPELQKEQDIAVALASQLQIKQRGKSDYYIISFTSISPKAAELVVKEVTDAYLEFHRKVESDVDNRIIRLLEEQRAARYEEMNQLRENVRSLSIQLKGIDPFRGETPETEKSKSQSPLAGLQASIIQFEVDQEVLAAHIKAEEEEQAGQKPEVPASEIEKQVVQNSRYLTLLAQIEKARLKQADYEKNGKNLDSNPLYKQLQSELSDSTQSLETLKVELRKEFKETLEKQLALHNADRLNAMKQEYASNQARLKVFQEKFKKNVGSAQQYTGDNLELEFRRSKLEQVTKIHDEIQLRILGITTEQRAPARVELFKEAALPVHPVELAPWKKIGMGAGAAFFVPFALVIAWEQLFRRVTSRSQLETFQRISVVGEITSLPTQLRGVNSTNRSTARDVSLFEESVDGLRTYLTLAEPLRDLRILAVTSASSNEGKTSLAAQLAVSIAKASGERILLIDGDMRSPDIHAIFDFDLSPGLAEVLRSECPLEEAIETGFSDKLHILTAGRLTCSPHQLLGNREFPELLEKLASIYRYIIVDTPPILPASEALVMARAADAAVLCVRRDFSRLDQVEEACRRMTAAGVRNAGAVLNGIPIKNYAYKYGSYAYSSDPAPASA